MKPRALTVLSGGALAALAAGLLVAGLALRQDGVRRERAARKWADARPLEALTRERARYLAARAAFERAGHAAPVALPDLVHTAAAGCRAEFRDLPSKPLAGGWVLRQVEVMFDDLAFDRLPRLLQVVESQRPPWRLAECALAAQSRTAGRGRVVLVLEAIGKEAPGPAPSAGPEPH